MKDPARVNNVESEENPPADPRVEWEDENIEIEGRDPSLDELDEDPESL